MSYESFQMLLQWDITKTRTGLQNGLAKRTKKRTEISKMKTMQRFVYSYVFILLLCILHQLLLT